MKTESEKFFRSFQLDKLPKSKKKLVTHQDKANQALKGWFHDGKEKGALLVIPTGGGKTFTAVNFLCNYPLNEGYKIIWLAHTHHLLEQAYYTFAPEDLSEGAEIAIVNRLSGELNIRVVSGEQNHYKVAEIEKTDDIVIGTVQTFVKAVNIHDEINIHEKLIPFLESTDKLFVVFDEAHHSVADSYRKLVQKLQNLPNKKVLTLGLTATPDHSDENKKKWFNQLYPKGVIPQPEITVATLTADNVLAKLNILEPQQTEYTPKFSESDYEKWKKAFHEDIPEYIISELAKAHERNSTIANTYDKQKHGKTIIFADRWYQCEALCSMLNNKGVKAGALYSHTIIDHSDADIRNYRRREKSQMKKDLEEFKNGNLDVLVNINILTEGTDVPSVDSVFITRQTTSNIKLRQMIGRALRGSKFGGTNEANLVLFVDNWKIGDIIGEFATLPTDLPFEEEKTKRQYAARYLVSMELVRKLADLMGVSSSIVPLTFDQLFPVGWYETIFTTKSDDSAYDIIENRMLVSVYEHEKDSYEKLIKALKSQDLSIFKEFSTSIDQTKSKLNQWESSFFNNEKSVSGDIERNIFRIAKHLSLNEEIVFYPFERRTEHDLEKIARYHYDNETGQKTISKFLHEEFERSDRFWKSLYRNYDNFKFHYDGIVNRFDETPNNQTFHDAVKEQKSSDLEASEDTKKAVKQRDENRCVCCGEIKNLEVDHIKPKYFEINHSMDNLQTLCNTCHKLKTKLDKESIFVNFLKTEVIKNITTEQLLVEIPKDTTEIDEKFLRRFFNFIFRTSSIESVTKRNFTWYIKIHKELDQKVAKKMIEELYEKHWNKNISINLVTN